MRQTSGTARARRSGSVVGPGRPYSRPMTTQLLDAPLLDRTDPAIVRPLPPALFAAPCRRALAARDLLAIPEAALARLWAWRPGGEERSATAPTGRPRRSRGPRSRRAPDPAADSGERQAARTIGLATAARWDLHGSLVPLDDALLDADPGGGEWSVRLTMGHIIAGQRGYAWGTAWWLEQAYDPATPDIPRRIDESLWETLPDEATTEAEGSVDDLRRRLDDILDLSAERMAGLPDDRLDLGSAWSGFHVSIGFRLGRWASHFREHDDQVEKNDALVGHVPSEPARLVRHVLASMGAPRRSCSGARASTRPSSGSPGARPRRARPFTQHATRRPGPESVTTTARRPRCRA